MCGIAGFVGPGAGQNEAVIAAVEAMSDIMRNRGPDGRGLWRDDHAVLSHLRLAIIDVSEAGHQPMLSQDERWALVYNGEIYNYQELRAELLSAGFVFRGHSDSETLLTALGLWGWECVLPRLNGIFAFVLWDRQDQTLLLARDQFGVKPLHYRFTATGIGFASELRALDHVPEGKAAIDQSALETYLRFGSLFGEETLLAGVRALPPGSVMTVRLADGMATETIRYHRTEDALGAAVKDPLTGSEVEILDTVEQSLSSAVERQMMSDVPLGAFLSGGIDSSLVVAMMQRHSERPVQTFSIGFDEKEFDESGVASDVAAHLGTDHHSIRLTPEVLMERAQSLGDVVDGPFGDDSFIPTLLLSEQTAQHVTVALSGDGGDELFGGYSRHIFASKLESSSGLRAAQKTASSLARLVPGGFERAVGLARARNPQTTRKIQKALVALGQSDEVAAYETMLGTGLGISALLCNTGAATSRPTALSRWAERCPATDHATWMQFMDLNTYMVDDVLIKVDRASMSCSLEVRVPFLDPELVSLAWRVPAHLKIRGGKGKWILRQVLSRHVPMSIVERPKSGFTVPLSTWFRGPMRDWLHDLLGQDALRNDDLLEATAVSRLLSEHQSGRRDRSAVLWSLAVLQTWRQTRA